MASVLIQLADLSNIEKFSEFCFVLSLKINYSAHLNLQYFGSQQIG
jgi:hypothetical protein